jgi:hypothetical protein
VTSEAEIAERVVVLLNQLYPGVRTEWPLAQRHNIDAIFEVPGFKGATTWGVEVKALYRAERINQLWRRLITEFEAGSLDRLLLVSIEPLDDDAKDAVDRVRHIEHITVQELEQAVSELEPGETPDIPASDRFIRSTDNQPDIDEAAEALAELATQVGGSNTLPLAREERDALLQEIRILSGMLQQRVVRLGQVQFAMGHDGVLNYLKNKLPDHAMGAVVSRAFDALGKAFSWF